MLLIPRTNPVNDAVCLEHIFLAQECASLLMCGVSAQDLTSKALSTVLVVATLRRIHPEQNSCLVHLHVLCLNQRYKKQNRHQALQLHGVTLLSRKRGWNPSDRLSRENL